MSSEEAAARPAIEMEEGEDDGEKSTLMAAAGKQVCPGTSSQKTISQGSCYCTSVLFAIKIAMFALCVWWFRMAKCTVYVRASRLAPACWAWQCLLPW